MGKFIDLTGQRFSRLVVIGRCGYAECGHIKWLCQCDCGNKIEVLAIALKRGYSQSCGCLRSEMVSAKNMTHGQSDTRIYHIWGEMLQRCTNPNNTRYQDYAGRGITVCDEWKTFENFQTWAFENGYCDNLSIDRRDNDGNYEPENCHWITMFAQAGNTRRNRRLTHNGMILTVAEWAIKTGIRSGTIESRLQRGWDVESALDNNGGLNREIAKSQQTANLV